MLSIHHTHTSPLQIHHTLHCNKAAKGKKRPEDGHVVKCLTRVTDGRSLSEQSAAGGQARGSAPSQKGKELDIPQRRRSTDADSRHSGVDDEDIACYSDTESDSHDDRQASSAISRPAAAASARSRVGVIPDGKKLPPRLTPQKLKAKRSPLPLWKMANEHVQSAKDIFAQPPQELNQLHRPMNGNMTYWRGDEKKLASCTPPVANLNELGKLSVGKLEVPLKVETDEIALSISQSLVTLEDNGSSAVGS